MRLLQMKPHVTWAAAAAAFVTGVVRGESSGVHRRTDARLDFVVLGAEPGTTVTLESEHRAFTIAGPATIGDTGRVTFQIDPAGTTGFVRAIVRRPDGVSIDGLASALGGLTLIDLASRTGETGRDGAPNDRGGRTR